MSLYFENLILRLDQKARASPAMVTAMVELTYGCNLRCVHCYNPTHEARGELSTKEVFRILEGLAAAGCLQVGFTGGELFTRRDTFEILRYAKSLGLLIQILTNATMITPRLADELQALEPYQIDVSLYGATAETYEKVTRVPGSFARFVQGVDLLNARRIPLILKIILMTLNAHELEAMREFSLGRKIPYKIGTEIHPRVDGSREPLAYRLPPEKVFEVWRESQGEEARQYFSSDHREDREACGSAGKLFDCKCGKTSAAITPYGKMNLCVSFPRPQYDLLRGSIGRGWESLVNLVARTTPGPEYECGKCRLAFCCTRGTVDGWFEQGKFDGPCLPWFRDLAERKAHFLRAQEKEINHGSKSQS